MPSADPSAATAAEDRDAGSTLVESLVVLVIVGMTVVVRLGPDPLSSEPGYTVACSAAVRPNWPPPPTPTCAACAPPDPSGWAPPAADVLAVEVLWDSHGSPRTLHRQAVIPQ